MHTFCTLFFLKQPVYFEAMIDSKVGPSVPGYASFSLPQWWHLTEVTSVIQYQDRDIDADAIQLTRAKALFSVHFLCALICVPVCVPVCVCVGVRCLTCLVYPGDLWPAGPYRSTSFLFLLSLSGWAIICQSPIVFSCFWLFSNTDDVAIASLYIQLGELILNPRQ